MFLHRFQEWPLYTYQKSLEHPKFRAKGRSQESNYRITVKKDKKTGNRCTDYQGAESVLSII
jgi:hypothetical protein